MLVQGNKVKICVGVSYKISLTLVRVSFQACYIAGQRQRCTCSIVITRANKVIYEQTSMLVALRQCAEMVGLNNLSSLIELLALVHAYLMKNQHGICMQVLVVVVLMQQQLVCALLLPGWAEAIFRWVGDSKQKNFCYGKIEGF